MKLDLAVERLRGKVKVAAVPEDMLLQIEVDDTDASRARDVAHQWGREFVELHQNKMAAIEPQHRIEIDLLDRPQPAVLNWPKRNQIMAAAAVLGLLLGTILAFVLEFLDDTLKSGEDVDRFVGLPLLAAIPPLGVAAANGHAGARAFARVRT